MFSSVYRIVGDGGDLLVEARGSRILFGIIAGHRHLGIAVDSRMFLEVLGNLVEEEAEADDGLLFMQARCIATGYYGCTESIRVPDRELIASMLLALARTLRRTPRATKAEDEDGDEYWAWSPQEEAAARKAAILLDLAAMVLRHPEVASKLPSDVEMLVQKSEEGTLMAYLKRGNGTKAAKTAGVVIDGC